MILNGKHPPAPIYPQSFCDDAVTGCNNVERFFEEEGRYSGEFGAPEDEDFAQLASSGKFTLEQWYSALKNGYEARCFGDTGGGRSGFPYVSGEVDDVYRESRVFLETAREGRVKPYSFILLLCKDFSDTRVSAELLSGLSNPYQPFSSKKEIWTLSHTLTFPSLDPAGRAVPLKKSSIALFSYILKASREDMKRAGISEDTEEAMYFQCKYGVFETSRELRAEATRQQEDGVQKDELEVVVNGWLGSLQLGSKVVATVDRKAKVVDVTHFQGSSTVVIARWDQRVALDGIKRLFSGVEEKEKGNYFQLANAVFSHDLFDRLIPRWLSFTAARATTSASAQIEEDSVRIALEENRRQTIDGKLLSPPNSQTHRQTFLRYADANGTGLLTVPEHFFEGNVSLPPLNAPIRRLRGWPSTPHGSHASQLSMGSRESTISVRPGDIVLVGRKPQIQHWIVNIFVDGPPGNKRVGLNTLRRDFDSVQEVNFHGGAATTFQYAGMEDTENLVLEVEENSARGSSTWVSRSLNQNSLPSSRPPLSSSSSSEIRWEFTVGHSQVAGVYSEAAKLASFEWVSRRSRVQSLIWGLMGCPTDFQGASAGLSCGPRYKRLASLVAENYFLSLASSLSLLDSIPMDVESAKRRLDWHVKMGTPTPQQWFVDGWVESELDKTSVKQFSGIMASLESGKKIWGSEFEHGEVGLNNEKERKGIGSFLIPMKQETNVAPPGLGVNTEDLEELRAALLKSGASLVVDLPKSPPFGGEGGCSLEQGSQSSPVSLNDTQEDEGVTGMCHPKNKHGQLIETSTPQNEGGANPLRFVTKSTPGNRLASKRTLEVERDDILSVDSLTQPFMAAPAPSSKKKKLDDSADDDTEEE